MTLLLEMGPLRTTGEASSLFKTLVFSPTRGSIPQGPGGYLVERWVQ